MGADASISEPLATALQQEVRRGDCLNRIATAIAVGEDLDSVVQAVVDGGVDLTDAAFGAFFYNVEDAAGERYMLYALSGAPREAFARYPTPRKTAIFAPTFDGGGVVRSDDITKDPRYGLSGPFHGMPDGHLPVRSYLAAPVVGRDGEVLGGLFFGHPESGRFTARVEDLLVGVAAQAAVAIETMRLKETARRELASLQFALKAGRMGSWELEVETGLYLASDICKQNYGRAPDTPFGFQDLIASIHPEDRPHMRAAIDAAIAQGSAYDIEYRVILPDGELRWIQARGRAAQTALDGGARRLAGVSLDITERKRAEQRQQLLLNELNHRVKNTLATVQAIARQTLRGCPDPEQFSQAFEARLLALSQTHNLLTAQNWRSASLMAILAAELRPHGGARDSRFMLEGDGDMQLNPKAALALGMAMHELATNAVKYGALSGPDGRVTLRSQRTGKGPDRKLVLDWIESGGPAVSPPSRRGLGARLLEDGLASELSSVVHLDYRPEGVACRIEMPMHVVETAE